MKPHKALIAAAALALGTTMAMAQSSAPTPQEATKSEMNKAVGDGSSGGMNAGAKDKIGAQGAATGSVGTTGAGATVNESAKVGVPKEGKTGDAVTTTGTGQMNQKKN